MTETANQATDNSYKDLSLFKDVVSPELRAHNRAAVMGNMTIDGQDEKGLLRQTSLDILMYYSMVPVDERRACLEKYVEYLKANGVNTLPKFANKG